MLARHQEPIVAIATAPGRGAVGIVRVSGRQLAPLIQALCRRPLKPREATYLPFADADGSPIDHGLALHFVAPHSFTGEDVLELQAHGGPVVLQLLVARCLQAAAEVDPTTGLPRLAGLRVAQPGEFSERAFLNDKIDLAQAEAIADLIDASTEAAARSASRALSGALSDEVGKLRDALIHLPCEDKQGAMDFVECVRSLRRFDATLAKTAFRKHAESGVAILSLPKNLADLREISASDALKFLNLIKSYFENVVIDLCGFSNIDFVASLLRSADQTLLVTPQTVPGVVTAAELMKALADKGVKSSTFDLVVTPHLKELALTPESISSKLTTERVHTLPDRRLALSNAVNEGTVLSVLDSRDPYTKAVAKILEDLGKARNKPEEVEGISQKLKSWFSK